MDLYGSPIIAEFFNALQRSSPFLELFLILSYSRTERPDEVVDMGVALVFRAAWGHGRTCAEQTPSTISFYVGLQGDLQLISELWKCRTWEHQNANRLFL